MLLCDVCRLSDVYRVHRE